MRILDRIFGWLMVVAALLHCYGSWQSYHADHLALLWALSGGIAEIYLAAMNLVRAERRHDLVIARLCVFGNVTWLAVICCFAAIIGHFFDVRVLIQFTITFVLLLLSLRARNRSRPM